MPNIATNLKNYSQVANVLTLVAPQHSVAEPRLVIQKRKVASGIAGTAETSIKVVYGTSDANGMPIASRIAFEATARNPVAGQSEDFDAALSLFREIVTSDEFTAAVKSQLWITG